MAAACADLVWRGTHGILSLGGTASASEDVADGFPGSCVHKSKIETPPQCSAEALAAFPIVNGMQKIHVFFLAKTCIAFLFFLIYKDDD